MKLTKDELITALRCCSDHYRNCTECPAFCDTLCIIHMHRQVIDAIENLQKQDQAQQDIIEKLKLRLEQTQAERDAAVSAVDRMAKYIVEVGRVDYFLCEDIPHELHLKHQPNNDGDYENGPCIECVKEYYLRGPQKEA